MYYPCSENKGADQLRGNRKSLHLIGQNSRARSQKQWRRFSRSSEIVNKQAKIMSASLKRMSDMGAKNGEGMLEVLTDDMGRS